VFVPSTLAPILAPMAPSFRLRRARSRSRIDRHRGALSRRGAYARFLRQLRRRAPHQPRAAAEADFQLLQYGEYLLASAIGAASSRLVLSLLLRKRTVSTKDALKLLDDANAAFHYNREIFAGPRSTTCAKASPCSIRTLIWFAGTASSARFSICRTASPASASRSTRFCATSPSTAPSTKRILMRPSPSASPNIRPRSSVPRRFAERGLVIEVRSNHMPDGGLVTTFTDITPSVKAAEALERAKLRWSVACASAPRS